MRTDFFRQMRPGPGCKMGTVKDFYEFLVEAELQHYYNGFKNDLKVTGVSQLKYVDEDDLTAMGMTRPEMRRLKKHYHRECPKGAFGKIKKRMSLRSQPSSKPVVSVDARPSKTSKHIIPLAAITACKTLGNGEFGVVQQGVWTNEDGERIQVAIKCLNKDKLDQCAGETDALDASKYQDFLREVTTMHTFDHENIVHMYGVVFDKECMMLITELAPLRSLSECLKEPNLRPTFTVSTLCDFAVQIASGMAYLEAKRLIHRDLAARNVLVFAKDKVKISDFGLSRALGMGKDYYQTNFNVNLKLPIAWCAPECINYLRFTTASDVWAFGVTMWEIFSYGFQPWAAMTGQQILEAIDEPSCQRLEMPDYCPKDYYDIMLRTWEHQENDRPTFVDLITQLRQSKPEDVRAVKDSPLNQMNKDYLDYKMGDIMTVLDKRPATNPDMYRGCLLAGRTGLFNPADVVPHAEHVDFKHMSPQYRRTKVTKKEATRKSASLQRNRISAAMISGPQADLRHTGHIGYDGFMFGDVSFIGDNYDKLPVKVGKGHLNGSSASLLSTDMSDSGSPTPVRPTQIGYLSKSSSSYDSSRNGRYPDSLTDTDSVASVSTLGADNVSQYEDVDDDFGNFKMPDMSPGFGLDFGSSLVDEIFKSLSSDADDKKSKAKVAEYDDDDDDGTPTGSPTKELPSMKEGRLKKFKHKLEIRRDNSVSEQHPDIHVKPMSASEEREMDHAIALANEIAKMNTCDTMLASSPKQASDQECESPRSKLTFRMPFKKSPKPERPSFCDEMDKIDGQEVELTEGQDVYNALVAHSRDKDRRQRRPQRVRRSGELNRLSADSSDADSRSTSSGEGRNSLVRTSSGEGRGPVLHRLNSEEEKTHSIPKIARPACEPPAPPPTVPPKPRVSPFTAEGKSFISAPLESTLDRKKIGAVKLESIERVQTGVRAPHNDVITDDRASSAVAEAHGLRRVLPDKPSADVGETNPLRMLRSGQAVFRPTGRVNGARKFSTDESSTTFGAYRRKFSADNTGVRASLASREENVRVPSLAGRGGEDNPPLPPRDVSRPGSLNIKPRQRKYPLVIEDTTYANAPGRSTARQRSSDSNTDESAPETSSNGKVNGDANHKGYTPLADCSAEQLGFFNDMDPFWTQEVTFEENGNDEMPSMNAKYKMPDSNVSYEDLLEFAKDSDRNNGPCDEVRLMQRVLSKEVMDDDCLAALEECCWNVHNAIKYIKLRQLLGLELGDIDVCKEALMRCNWSIVDAADFMIDNPLNSPECVDV